MARLSCCGAELGTGPRGKVRTKYLHTDVLISLSCVSLPDGWTYDTSYRFHITHLPDCGIIRLKLYEGAKLLHDSGYILDNGAESLRGGRLGVYCDSQESIMWSALSYKYVRPRKLRKTS